MTTEEPRVVDSGRYGMSDAAKILGVARCTLRRWIYAGRVNVGFRNLNGRMFITGQELKEFGASSGDAASVRARARLKRQKSQAEARTVVML